MSTIKLVDVPMTDLYLDRKGSTPMSYQSEYQASIQQPEKFWAEKAADLPWFKQPQTILSKDENGIDRWFEP